jgi:hypothetical protein
LIQRTSHGKLCSSFESGESYNNQIAVKRVLEGVRGILTKVSSFNIDKILFIGGTIFYMTTRKEQQQAERLKIQTECGIVIFNS